ncbi:hypothetical protein [Nocardiopsis sp. CNT312]|uniref:hypothetical protein n=1 Tax=Nocardiopsis sp. CNT312 TaxID=1137268 RepID=UPI0004920EE7|nr:hypothetical protein [Nocardiopsis sp. CNT312]
MVLYAQRPLRAFLQLVADLIALAWIYLWVKVALALRETITALERPGELLAEAGSGVSEHMDTAAGHAEGIPLVGDEIAVPFTQVGEAGTSLTNAGTSFQESVAELAFSLPLLVAALALLLLAATWLPARARWIRAANAAGRTKKLDPAARDRLLALRALTSAPTRKLAGVHEDPAGAWRSEDQETIGALAALELKRLGLRSR